MWNYQNNKIIKVMENKEENLISSVTWNTLNNNLLGIGSLSGTV